MRSVVAAMLLLAVPALAQEVTHPPHGTPDPYLGMTTAEGRSCCNGSDCGVATACMAVGGELGWVERGQCHVLPSALWRPPTQALEHDARLHVCRRQSWVGSLFAPTALCWTGGGTT